ncbi:uncharacterized protein LOC120897103 [Anopheles arabiensis]|uniref:uncharacterized protein LOC120897103 n=1 Tax=Anopheles arabiensis TaxID=7173 RepID=UPI001AAD5A26|nr:uncharacterized protein LOC120897103 [Anopheles arabiensis]
MNSRKSSLPESVSQEAQEDEESIPVGNEDSDDGADSSSNDDLFSDFSEDSECSTDSLDGRNVQFRDKLRRWALSCNLIHFAVGSLLTLLKEETSFKLAKDPRTLLKTKKATSNVIENIGGGEFWYNGVANCLTSYFTNIKPKASTFWLDFAMDGLPIH